MSDPFSAPSDARFNLVMPHVTNIFSIAVFPITRIHNQSDISGSRDARLRM